jgi:hypothetical protein
LQDNPALDEANPDRGTTMKLATDYFPQAARLARKIQMDAPMGGKPEPDATPFEIPSKTFEEIAAGLEMVSARE